MAGAVTVVDWSDFVIRQPPADLEPHSFKSGVPAMMQALNRMGGLEPKEPPPPLVPHYNNDPLAKHPRVSEAEFTDLVLAQAWMLYVDERWSRSGCPPFAGQVADYIDATMTQAARDMQEFVTRPVPVWEPKMWRSRPLHRAVTRVLLLREKEHGGGCELCHAPGRSEVHHLHYRSFSHEVPSDVVHLCRACHEHRHRVAGYPQDVRWTDATCPAVAAL